MRKEIRKKYKRIVSGEFYVDGMPDVTLYKHEFRLFNFTLFRWGKYTVTFEEAQKMITKAYSDYIERQMYGSIKKLKGCG